MYVSSVFGIECRNTEKRIQKKNTLVVGLNLYLEKDFKSLERTHGESVIERVVSISNKNMYFRTLYIKNTVPRHTLS